MPSKRVGSRSSTVSGRKILPDIFRDEDGELRSGVDTHEIDPSVHKHETFHRVSGTHIGCDGCSITWQVGPETTLENGVWYIGGKRVFS